MDKDDILILLSGERRYRHESRLGIQPPGNLHLGNYLGAIVRWARIQYEPNACFFLADLHAITVYNDPTELRAMSSMAAALIACGSIRNARSSSIRPDHAHAEMAWILNARPRIGWLNRMTQFKERAARIARGPASASMPIRSFRPPTSCSITPPTCRWGRPEAACRADPRHRDPSQHRLQVRGSPSRAFDRATAARIMSLRDGSAKMSKSDPSDMSRINLTDDSDLVAQKIRRPKPMPSRCPTLSKGLTGGRRRRISRHLATLADRTPADVFEFAGKGFGRSSRLLAELTVETLRRQARLDDLEPRSSRLELDPGQGSQRAAAMARPTLEAAYEALGLSRYPFKPALFLQPAFSGTIVRAAGFLYMINSPLPSRKARSMSLPKKSWHSSPRRPCWR